MKTSPLVAGLLLWIGSAAMNSAQADEPIGLAVFEFRSKGGVSQEQMDGLSDYLAAEIRKIGDFRVVGKSDIRAAMALEEQKMLLGCDDESCMAELGGALGVRWLVSGSVTRLGDSWVLNLMLLDAKAGRVFGRVSARLDGDEQELISALTQQARELFHQNQHGFPPGVIRTMVKKQTSSLAVWGHVTLWSGVAVACLGGLALWQAGVAADDYGRNGDLAAADRNSLYNGLSATGFVIGGLLMATGATFWILSSQGPKEELVFAAGPDPFGRGAFMAVGGRW
jgi:TolB-like protein